jgi:hypothetical protein
MSKNHCVYCVIIILVLTTTPILNIVINHVILKYTVPHFCMLFYLFICATIFYLI